MNTFSTEAFVMPHDPYGQESSLAGVAVAGDPDAVANDLHRALDVSMNEDGQRSRTANGMRGIVAIAGKSGDDVPDSTESEPVRRDPGKQVDVPDAEDGHMGRSCWNRSVLLQSSTARQKTAGPSPPAVFLFESPCFNERRWLYALAKDQGKCRSYRFVSK